MGQWSERDVLLALSAGPAGAIQIGERLNHMKPGSFDYIGQDSVELDQQIRNLAKLGRATLYQDDGLKTMRYGSSQGGEAQRFRYSRESGERPLDPGMPTFNKRQMVILLLVDQAGGAEPDPAMLAGEVRKNRSLLGQFKDEDGDDPQLSELITTVSEAIRECKGAGFLARDKGPMSPLVLTERGASAVAFLLARRS